MDKSKLSLQREFYSFLNLISDFFQNQGLEKVYTPSLVKCPGLEPYLHGFKTQFKYGGRVKDYYLPTSPVLHLKKLICLGMSDLFEIKTCFRNDELTDHHRPEFQMLEWYRVGAELDLLKEDISKLLNFLQSKGFLENTSALPKEVSMAELFKNYLDFELTPETNKESLSKLLESLNINVESNDSWDDLFFKVFVNHIEPKFKEYSQPLIVSDYPPSQAALAKLNKKGWADRFELYINGVELANAFNELSEPKEQLKRFKNDQKIKEGLGFDTPPIDDEFMKALEMGLPQTAGIALGLDRLFMVCKGFDKLEKFNLFGNYEAD